MKMMMLVVVVVVVLVMNICSRIQVTD
ncbi:hypothetical protein QR98_0064230 [Sarcoptes scabiei]|uniref:Uncharacterized protein n=1 Tax=Sarcoptes scabiei TaxID=52283 RepID=A0A132AA94_SARSC|nr:hypothetical protein QR98_0064230 [Sarcoptes scabiei]